MKKITVLLVLLLTVHLTKAQDTCSTALPIGPGFYVIDVINGSQVPAPLCETQYGEVPATRPPAGEWYVYTPTENHSVTVTTDLVQNTPLIDTRFHVYSGSCDALVCHEGDDDGGTGLSSTATFDVIANTTYYIAFDNRWISTGFTFRLTENVFVPNPCNSATPVTAGVTTVSAIDEDIINTPCSSGTLAKWYAYTPTNSAVVTISSDLVQNTCMNTTFSVYTGTCVALTCLVSDDDSGIITCDTDNFQSLLSTKTFNVSAGQTYYIAWSNQYSADGFDFEITETPIIIPIDYTLQTLSTVNSTYNICVVDMNNDNIDDIVGVSTNNLKVHYQQPDGTFTISNYTVSGTSFLPTWSMAAGDYNDDGFNDLVLGSGSGLSVWTSNDTGTGYSCYTPGEYIFCQRTNFADLNQDGNLDVFSCHDIAPNAYYLNDGAANLTYFQSSVTPGAMSIGAAGGNYSTLFTDFDNDGDTDVFISKCSGPPCELHRNDGNGVYTNISALAQINVTPIQTWSSAIADFDNDGDMDIIITSSGSTHKFFRNNLDTTNDTEEAYTNITLGSGWDTNTSTNIDNIAYDFDNDGLVDVLGGGGKIMFNQGNNFFAPTAYPAITGFPQIAVGAVGDLNNDGFLDILNQGNIRYAIPNGNNWIKVLLQGIQSNSNGIGARVEIYGDFGKQIRDIRSGEGFKYMSSLNAHFGIGQSTAITQLVVRWPSGIVDTFLNPDINAAFRVTEGVTLGVNANTNSVFTIYPNPAKQILSISVDANSTEILKSAQIFDLTGRLVLETTLTSSQINIGTLQSGTYLLLLKNEQGKGFTQKFIKE
ncbi:MAG: VCBS repeat-containing protein [Flavobacterium sp.]|nr:VCBS repeat-containing protein [Flavobacterium sp.]